MRQFNSGLLFKTSSLYLDGIIPDHMSGYSFEWLNPFFLPIYMFLTVAQLSFLMFGLLIHSSKASHQIIHSLSSENLDFHLGKLPKKGEFLMLVLLMTVFVVLLFGFL